MPRDTKIIMLEIKALFDELDAAMREDDISSEQKKSGAKKSSSVTVPKGAMGAVNILIGEGFLDTPKDMSSIMEKLEEIGHYHKRGSISMNLLNLTKRRMLNRFKNKDTKNWEYVIRR